jgi:transcriptional regulator with XRE-family HTH domain
VSGKAVESVRTRESDALLTVLRAARKSAHLTQRDLSLKMGKSFSYIAKIEKGTRRIDVVEFIELATALGIDPNELFNKVTDQIATG